jgi:Flp pilus assembly protein TadD
VVELSEYIANDPFDRWSRIALGDSLRRIGRFTDAEKTLAPLPASDPDARALRARIALDRGDDDSALALLAEGPENHAELARLRGRFALARRDWPGAVKQFRAAYAAEPDNRDAVFGLGQALSLIGDSAAAAPFVTLARDFDALGTLMQRASSKEGRTDPQLMRGLGGACEKIRRPAEARAWYRLAIQANPLDQDAQKALFRLDAPETARAGL